MTNSPPRRVYYYTSEAHALDILKDRQIKISRFKECNDPFELEAVDLSDKKFRRAFKAVMDAQNEKAGLLCFSKTWRNPVMWAHYANKHKGICIELDIDSTNSFDVRYTSEKLYPGLNGSSFKSMIGEEQMADIFGTKALSWAYEEEVRVLCQLTEPPDDNGRHFFAFGKDLNLVGVFVGQSCEIPLSQITAAVNDPQVHVTPTRRAFGSFRVVRQKDSALWKS